MVKLVDVDATDENAFWLRRKGFNSAKALLASLNKYSEDQERDERGRWTSGGYTGDTNEEAGHPDSSHASNLMNMWHRVITTTADNYGESVRESIQESIADDPEKSVQSAISDWAENPDVVRAVKETVAYDLINSPTMQAVSTEALISAARNDVEMLGAMEKQPNETYTDEEDEYHGITIVEYSGGGLTTWDGTDALPNLTSDEYDMQQAEDGVGALNSSGGTTRWAIAGTPEAEALVREAAASVMVNQWAQTSNDTNAYSQAMQEAAAEQFGIEDHAAWEGMTPELKAETDSVFEQHGDTYKAFLQAQYENTQANFKAAGIESVAVYRGNSQMPKEYDGEVTTRPLSSWSTSFYTAGNFAGNGVIYRTEIPVEKILSTAGTGFGCLSEYEVVAFGGTYQADAISNLAAASPDSYSTDGNEDGAKIEELFTKFPLNGSMPSAS